MLYIVGLGSGEGLGDQALEIARASYNIVKTNLTYSYTAVERAGIEHITLDELYEKSQNFDTLNANIVKRIQEELKTHDRVCYLVDGSGFDDDTVAMLLQKYRARIIPAASKYTRAFYPETSHTCYSATEFLKAIDFDRDIPLFIYEIDSRELASEVKLKLASMVGDTTIVRVRSREMVLADIDRLDRYDYSITLLMLPKDYTERNRYGFNDLMGIMRKLISEDGCPWDRAQTLKTVRMNVIEEAYEVAEAIDLGDDAKLEEELGDLLLQAVFEAVISEKEGGFGINDVLTGLCSKLVFRHSHIFGKDKPAKGSDDALETWEKNKAVEKGQETVKKQLDDIAKALPALLRAQKAAKRASKGGQYNLSESEVRLAAAMKKLSGELESFKKATGKEQISFENTESEQSLAAAKKVRAAAGAALFEFAAELKNYGVDAEEALQLYIGEFIAKAE